MKLYYTLFAFLVSFSAFTQVTPVDQAASQSPAPQTPYNAQVDSSASKVLALKPTEHPELLTLEDILRGALEKSMDLVSLNENLKRMRAQYHKAWSALWPKISFGGTYTHNIPGSSFKFATKEQVALQSMLYGSVADLLQNQGSDIVSPATEQKIATFRTAANQALLQPTDDIVILPKNLFEANATFSMPILNAMAIVGVMSTKAQTKAMQDGVSFANQTAILEVSKLYTVALTTKKMVQVAQNQLDRMQAHEKFAREKFQVGLTNSLDADRAKLEVLKAKDDLQSATQGYKTLIAHLGSLIGVDIEFDLVDTLNLGDIPAMPLDEMIAYARENRSDIKSQKKIMSVVKLARYSGMVSWIPTLNLLGQVRYTTNTSGLVSQPWTGAIMVNGNFTLFDGGYRSALTQEGKSQLHEQRYKLDHMRMQVDSEVRGAQSNLKAKKQSLERAQEGFKVASQMFKNAEVSYRNGLLNSLNLIDASQALAFAEADLKKSETELEQAKLSLLHAAGLLAFSTMFSHTL